MNVNQKYRYTGKPFDNDNNINLYYYGARYYDPEAMRFYGVDPLHGKYPGTSPYVHYVGGRRLVCPSVTIPIKITINSPLIDSIHPNYDVNN